MGGDTSAVGGQYGVSCGIDWLGIVGSLVVLFAVLRCWPAEPEGEGAAPTGALTQ